MTTLDLTHRLPSINPALRRGRVRAATSALTGRSTGRLVKSWALIALMWLISLALWTAVPAGVVWLAGRLSESTTPSGATIALLVVGVPAAMMVVARAFARLGDLQLRVSGGTPQPYRPPWQRSISDSSSRAPVTTAAKIMVASASLAILALVSYIVLAGAPAPVT